MPLARREPQEAHSGTRTSYRSASSPASFLSHRRPRIQCLRRRRGYGSYSFADAPRETIRSWEEGINEADFCKGAYRQPTASVRVCRVVAWVPVPAERILPFSFYLSYQSGFHISSIVRNQCQSLLIINHFRSFDFNRVGTISRFC